MYLNEKLPFSKFFTVWQLCELKIIIVFIFKVQKTKAKRYKVVSASATENCKATHELNIPEAWSNIHMTTTLILFHINTFLDIVSVVREITKEVLLFADMYSREFIFTQMKLEKQFPCFNSRFSLHSSPTTPLVASNFI